MTLAISTIPGFKQSALFENKMFRMYNLNLASGASQKLTVQGNFFHLFAAIGTIDVVFDEQNKFTGIVTGVSLGLAENQYYNDVEITNTASETQALKVVLGFGKLVDTRAAVSINNVQSDTLSSVADVTVSTTAVSVSAQNEDQRAVIIGVPFDAANGIRVGDSAITATRGIYVGIGQSITLETNAQVFAIRDGAADVDVSVLSLLRSN